jgi:hypothetical protein
MTIGGRAILAGMSIDGLHRKLGRTGPTVTAVALGCSSCRTDWGVRQRRCHPRDDPYHCR